MHRHFALVVSADYNGLHPALIPYSINSVHANHIAVLAANRMLEVCEDDGSGKTLDPQVLPDKILRRHGLDVGHRRERRARDATRDF